MLDIKWIISNPKEADEFFNRRGVKPISSKIIELNKKRSLYISEIEKLYEKRNLISKKIGTNISNVEKEKLLKEVKKIKDKILKLEKSPSKDTNELNNLLLQLPNFLDTDVPNGTTENDNIEIRKTNNIKNFDFVTKDHVHLGEKLDLLDFTSAAKVSGARFAYLKGNMALLERALINFMLDINIKDGKFKEISTPFLVNEKSLIGTGQLPKFDRDIFKTRENFWLIPTSEVTLVNLGLDKIFQENDLPIRYTSYTPCFRSEAGAAGKDTKGLKRQHQFGKVELVSFSVPNKSKDEHEYILSISEKILQKLDLPYRICELCSSEVGFASKKTYDVEVWLPSIKNYMEISSVSNCGCFQARRINAKFEKNKQKEFIHTLNGSSLAVGRTIIAIMENYQNSDGSISVPDVLKKYMNNLERL